MLDLLVMICTFPSSTAIFNLAMFFPHVTNAHGNLTISLSIDISSLIPKEPTITNLSMLFKYTIIGSYLIEEKRTNTLRCV